MTIRIFKLPMSCSYAFMNYNFAVKNAKNNKVTIYDYVNVYTYDIEHSDDILSLLDEIFEKFNVNHPDDYYSSSLSVSDVVMVDDDAYYCDSFGWQKLPDWR